MKETYYFPHDLNAIQDPKMMFLLSECGLKGIGIYWILVEILHQQSDGRITNKQFQQYIKFYSSFETSGEHLLNRLEHVLIESELLIKEEDFVFSNRVIENKQKMSDLSEKRSFAGKKSAELRMKIQDNQLIKTVVQQNSTGVEQMPTKENKIKENKIKENKKDSIGEIANPLFPAFISAYDGFIKHLTNVPAKINGKEGKAAKEIINYMTRACRNKNATATDEDVLNAFRYVLDNYAKWEKFHQGQLELSQISKNLVNIINAIKNGRVDKVGKAPATDPADIRRIVEAGILSVTVP